MCKRFFLLLLIALLPLQGIAASLMLKCGGTPGQHAMMAMDPHEAHPCHEAMPVDDCCQHGQQPHQQHHDQGDAAYASGDHCCHNLAAIVPLQLEAPDGALPSNEKFLAVVAAYLDHFPDQPQRPPLALPV